MLRRIDGVLAGHRIGDQQAFMRLHRIADRGDLGHQLFVDREAARGIEHDDVVAFEAAGIHGALGDGDRRLARHDGQRLHAGLLAQDGQLLLGGGTARVQRGHQHLLALLLGKAARDLGGRGGLAGTLQAQHQDGHGRRVVEVEPGAFALGRLQYVRPARHGRS